MSLNPAVISQAQGWRGAQGLELVSFLIAHLGNTITEGRALEPVDHLGQAGHLAIDEKGAVTYHVAHQ